MLDEKRLARVLKEMEGMGLKQMLVSDPVAIFYLTNHWFFPGERFLGLLIRANAKPVLYLNDLFPYEEEKDIDKVGFCDTDDIIPLLKAHVIESEPLGVDKNLEALFLLPMMNANIATTFVNGSIAIDNTRAIKDKKEEVLMRTSSHINDLAMAQFVRLVHPGVTEIEIADQMFKIYESLGASAYSFDPIVSFGANAADPHHSPDHTVLKEGDCILFDVGCIVDNYCSDMTRTFFYKYIPDQESQDIYNLVLQANVEAENMVKPDITLSSIDLKAREIITNGGYGENFTHRLGHFIGLQDHDFGDVSCANGNLTKAGNVFSIEPGIYVPGKIGVRIEDLVLVTENGHEILNEFPKEISIIE